MNYWDDISDKRILYVHLKTCTTHNLINLTAMGNKSDSELIVQLKREIAFQKVEIDTLTSELLLSQEEHVFQNNEKQKRADELFIANKELVFQNEEKQKRAEELFIAHEELVFQNNEKQKRADELIIANAELVFQNAEKHKRADELIIANAELIFQNKEKHKRAEELVMANKHLDVQHQENTALTEKLTLANGELQKTENYLRTYIKGLEEVIFITSHKVRQPVTQILGIANLIDQSADYSLEELRNIIGYVKKSALALDDFTKELTLTINQLKKEGKNRLNNR